MISDEGCVDYPGPVHIGTAVLDVFARLGEEGNEGLDRAKSLFNCRLGPRYASARAARLWSCLGVSRWVCRKVRLRPDSQVLQIDKCDT